MTHAIQVRYYDGVHNRPHSALLSVENEHLCIRYDTQTDFFPCKQVAYMASVGKVLPALELPNDARVEFLSHEIPDWLPLQHKSMLKHVAHFEKSWTWVGVGFVVVLCVILAMFKWGIPAASYYAAHTLSEQTLQDAGNQAETMVIKLTHTSKLPEKRQQEIQALYQTLNYPKPAKIVFRQGGKLIKANAFAIPNNTIVLTDELVNLANNDHQILAVLAHEQGHLHHRHSLQQVFRGVGIGVFLLIITGDASDLMNNLPIMLIGAQYSQAFEMEADLYAINELKRLKHSPQHMADILVNLHRAHDGDETDSNLQLISTHPSLHERVHQVQQHVP